MLNRSTSSATRMAVAVAAIVALLARSACRAELDKRQLDLLDKADRSNIAPDLIETIPRAIFEARFKAGEVAMGNQFSTQQASAPPPFVEFPRTAGGVYAIAMVDLDAPSARDPKFRPILHWLVINVEAGDVKGPVNYKKGNELYKYRRPKPPMGSGRHRYVFLAYKQYRTIEAPQTLVVPSDKRRNFNIGKFAKENNLGNPIAINYFLAEQGYVDAYTPMLSWVMVVTAAITGFVCRLMLM
ncbi:protein D3-like [Dermacentor andersoni]|uniref:protein D3-like n=1 Tax=Dermacentor andersoni TaxID=34620 RepID=UPI002155549C|nr:protein D3-like [Dermacentor andersoni]